VLTTLGGTNFGSLEVGANTALTSFSLPALTSIGGGLNVESNTALTSFSLPALTTLGSLFAANNTALPQCLALAFKDHMIAAHGFTGSWTISGNDATATCPP
jgi:hypothetical protein